MLLRRTRTWTVSTIAVVAAAMLAVGCQQNEEKKPGGIIDPDPDSADASMQGFATDRTGSSSRDYSGTIFGEASVEISADGSTWYMLGGSKEFDVKLVEGEEAAITDEKAVESNTYRHVRINFEGVEAVIEEGSTVEGHTLESDVQLRLGDTGNGVTSKEVPAYELEGGGSARIILNMNSEAWVLLENLEAREIPKEEFEERVTIELVGGS